MSQTPNELYDLLRNMCIKIEEGHTGTATYTGYVTDSITLTVNNSTREISAEENDHKIVKSTAASSQTLNLTLVDKRIYYISGYKTIKISVPSSGNFTCHLFISVPDESDSSISLPQSLNYTGTSLSLYDIGQTWEFSIDSTGGIIGLKTS